MLPPRPRQGPLWLPLAGPAAARAPAHFSPTRRQERRQTAVAARAAGSTRLRLYLSSLRHRRYRPDQFQLFELQYASQSSYRAGRRHAHTRVRRLHDLLREREHSQRSSLLDSAGVPDLTVQLRAPNGQPVALTPPLKRFVLLIRLICGPRRAHLSRHRSRRLPALCGLRTGAKRPSRRSGRWARCRSAAGRSLWRRGADRRFGADRDCPGRNDLHPPLKGTTTNGRLLNRIAKRAKQVVPGHHYPSRWQRPGDPVQTGEEPTSS